MRLSQEKIDKITEQILFFLYHTFPDQPFTSKIAREIARDEEFVKRLLFDLKEKGLIIPIRKNSKGISFNRRIRWRLSSRTYEAYKTQQ